MPELLNPDDDQPETLTKTKQKKPRTEAQQASTQKMLTALEVKRMKLQAIKDKLNNAPPLNPAPQPPDETSDDETSEPEPEPVKPTKKAAKATPVKAAKEVPVSRQASPVKAPKGAPKQPTIIYQSDSDSQEEEIVIVKKKKKPKKKTIIYEESESEDEEPIKRVHSTRDTKTQQNKSSFRVTAPAVAAAKPAPLYYFAD